MTSILLNLLLLAFVTPLQINFYQTDPICEQENQHERYHCLAVPPLQQSSSDPLEIINYCLTECPYQWSMDHLQSEYFSSFTFEQLAQQNVTSHELYLWSASIDLIENYEHYLNQPSQSRNISEMKNNVFYNCTWPRFGPVCQYSFDHLIFRSSMTEKENNSFSSLTELVYDYYAYYIDNSIELTCYEHLSCNRGPTPSCLDWSEICDGRIDCIDGGQDEAHCWQLEVNECETDQYRCLNGQCISKVFYDDNLASPDCLDASDEPQYFSQRHFGNSFYEPGSAVEDGICETFHSSSEVILTSSCSENRNRILTQTLLTTHSNNISEQCWLAFLCIINYPPSPNSCFDYCSGKECEEIIQNNCSTTFMLLPGVPLLFGHLYFAYTKDYLLKSKNHPSPEFICMNKQFCSSLLTINNRSLQFNDTICYHSESIQMTYPYSPPFPYPNRFIFPTLLRFRSCASLPETYFDFCSDDDLYRCANTSKCISKHRLLDKIKDCYFGDDEQIDFVRKFISVENNPLFFQCDSSTNYISHRLVGDGLCNCPTEISKTCNDEKSDRLYSQTHFSFQTQCDGFTELKPVLVDGKSITDETDCEYWPCDNIYTRCDGIWNCLDGRDEIGCNASLSMTCQADHQLCVSFNSSQWICLPFEKFNDGHIDCLGATDERKVCRSDNYEYRNDKFHCKNDSLFPCIPFATVCDGFEYCTYGDDQNFCEPNETSLIKEFFARQSSLTDKSDIVYFSLVDRPTRQKQLEAEATSLLPTTLTEPFKFPSDDYHKRCQRGLPLRFHNHSSSLDAVETNETIVCLCPPGFYGRQCQYQNQRVSLTLQFRVLSDAWQTLFSAFILLIDQTYERSIHSSQQFTFLPFRDCEIKFNLNLLFSTQPRNDSLNYSIHIDIYESFSRQYRGSYLIPIRFSFLPITRIALQLDIPRLLYSTETIESCNDLNCGKHGRCVRYNRVYQLSSVFSALSVTSFCQCDHGWSGRYCTISNICSCSSQAMCFGKVLKTNRSICLCPVGKFGHRCLLSNDHVCLGNASYRPCLNNGQCIPNDEYQKHIKLFTCLCPKGYTGDRCEQKQTELIISFHSQLIPLLPQSMLVHFIQYHHNDHHENSTTFKRIPIDHSPVSIYALQLFHVAFIEFYNHKYYLAIVRSLVNRSETTLEKVIQPSDRCPPIQELLPSKRLHPHRLIRMKSYHSACQTSITPSISCFFDAGYFCLCQTSSRGRREANCFEYDHQRKFDCFGLNACENNGQCFQDNPTCPRTSLCICKECSYGLRCQFTMDGFRLSLDAILGYQIQPNLSIVKQPTIIVIAFSLTIVIAVIGFVNGIFTLLTFKNNKLRQVGCGFYLLSSSIAVLFTMILFTMKFIFLLTSQNGLITNPSFLLFQCQTIDYFLRVCVNLDQWFSSCVSCERAVTIIRGVHFDKSKSKKKAKYVILTLIILVSASSVYDPINRRLIEENIEDEYRIWCIASYTGWLKTWDPLMSLFHFAIPFLINISSASVIIWKSARSRRKTATMTPFGKILTEQIKQHKHILIGPTVIVILSVPRLVLAIVSGCMKSSSQSWIYLTTYMISFTPTILTFIIFVLPSKLYKKEFQQTIRQYRNMTRTSFHIARHLIKRN